MKKYLIIISSGETSTKGWTKLHIQEAMSLEGAFDALSASPYWQSMIREAKVMFGASVKAFEIASEVENADERFDAWEAKYLTSPKKRASTVADAIFDEMSKLGERAKSYLSGPEVIKDATHFITEAKKLGSSLVAKKTLKNTKQAIDKVMKNLEETTDRLLEEVGLKTPISKD